MEIEADRDHMTVFVKVLIFNVLVFRPNIFQPNISICGVDRNVITEKKLEPSSSMEPEPILRIIEITRAFHRGVVPPAAAEQKGGQAGMTQGVDQRGHLHGIGVNT